MLRCCAPLGLWPGAMQSFSVLLAVVFYVGSVQDILDPLGVFKVPVDGPAEAFFEAYGRAPAELLVNLCRIQDVFALMVKITISRESHIG